MTYARNTTVSAIRTRNEIEETLKRCSADGFAYATQGNLSTVIFAMTNRRIRFILELPDPQEFRYTNHNPRRERGARAQREAYDQACRQRWRALPRFQSGLMSLEIACLINLNIDIRHPPSPVVASSQPATAHPNLPGSVIRPAPSVADATISRNQQPSCRQRHTPCWPGRSGFDPRSQIAIAASRNARPASTVVTGSPAALAPSSRNAAHHSADSGSGLAPATPDQGCCWGCQLAAARCSRAAAVIVSAAANNSRSRARFLVRRRTPLARTATGQRPLAVPYRRPGQSRPGTSLRFPQFRNAGSAHRLTPRSVSPSNPVILSPVHPIYVNINRPGTDTHLPSWRLGLLSSARGNVIQRCDHDQCSNHDFRKAECVPAAECSGLRPAQPIPLPPA